VTIAVFAGCRDLEVGRWWWPALDAIRDEHGITEVWHGACGSETEDGRTSGKLKGVDEGIDTWALVRDLRIQRFPAPWGRYRKAGLDDKKAGMRRVRDMLAGARGYQLGAASAKGEARVVTTELVPGHPALVVCLPGGPGTQGTAKEGQRLGLPVVRVPMVYKPGVPRVVNLHHHAMPGAADRRPPLPEPWRYIGRSPPLGPSPVANPYTVEEHGRKALELYKDWLREKLKRRDPLVLEELRSIPADAHLVCHCVRPDGSGACHGRTVALAWEWLRKQDTKRDARAA
jgi:hypothetical protein